MDEITNPALNSSIKDLEGAEFFNKFLPNLIGLSFVIGVVVFVAIIIVGAIQWIISGGDKAGIESAKGKITNAVVGIIILLALFAIIAVVENFFGVEIINPKINFLE